jgi:hypothetical protein
MGDHNPVAGRVHFRADRIAKPAHSARDYRNAHECPPCLIAEVNEFSMVSTRAYRCGVSETMASVSSSFRRGREGMGIFGIAFLPGGERFGKLGR